MKLPVTNEIIASPDGIACAVLDIKTISFVNAQTGRKSAETLVRCATGGEQIETRNKEHLVEHVYTAKAGDAVFINLHDMRDMYVPGNPDGSRWQFSELNERGYVITGDDQINGGIRVKNAASFPILHEAVEGPVCIKHAWGENQHQFLFKGATLKLNNNGLITGIDKSAFDATWEITPAKNKPAASAPKRHP